MVRSTPRVISVPVLVVRKGMGAITLTAPVAGRVSSDFGPRSAPVAGASTDHKGMDFAVPVGTPVSASAAGVVSFAGQQSGYGNVVKVDHGGGLVTLYAHLSELRVSQGDRVYSGDVIGLSGATGTVSGPNLHFGVYVQGVAVDPESWLVQASTPAIWSAVQVPAIPGAPAASDTIEADGTLEMVMLAALAATAVYVVAS